MPSALDWGFALLESQTKTKIFNKVLTHITY